MADTIQTRQELDIILIVRNDKTTAWESTSYKLEVGELGMEYLNNGKVKLKAGAVDSEGNLKAWKDLPYIGADEAQVYQTEVLPATDTTEDEDAIANVVNGAELHNGDCAIVKRAIGDSNKVAYTSYVYNGTSWAAMDGNYSAENVFTSKKITLAGNYTSIGNYSKGKEFVAGTSLQTILSGMLQTTIQPSKTAPTATISASGDDGGKETGDTYTKPTGTITVTSGSYTNEGTATGVKYLAGAIAIAYGADPEEDKATYRNTNSGELGNGGTVTMPASTYASGATTAYYTDDSVSYTFSGMARNEAGIVAKDNLGEASNPVVQIGAGDLTVADKTVSFRGYRKMFIGCTSEALTSDIIRGLSLKNAKATTGAVEVTAPVGATQLVVAVPTKSVGKKYTMTKAEMYTSNWEDYTSLFSTAQTIKVADKRGGTNGEQDYNVYTYSFAALKAATRFRITLANANA